MRNQISKLAVLVATSLVAFTLCACGEDWSVGPGDGSGSSGGRPRTVNKRFHYYYGEDCRYDSFGAYDCTDVYALSPSMYVSLQVTYDGYATLCVDNECSYYDPGEYYEGYSHGDYYYDFSGDDTRMTIYMDGSELVYIDTYKGYAYYYYYDNPDYYDYYY